MTDDEDLCVCRHQHATTRGPCDRQCGCITYEPDDTPLLIARRRRELLAAVHACPHDLHRVRRDARAS